MAVGIVAILLLIVGVVGAVILFRQDVLQAVLEDRLAAMGLAEATFSVERVSEDEIRIVDFRADEALRIGRITLRYEAGELLEGRLRRIEIAGLRADLSRPGEGAIGVLLRGEEDKTDRAAQSVGLPAIPAIRISDAKLRASAAGRKVALDLDGTVGPLRDGKLTTRMKLGLETTEGRLEGPLNLDVAFVGNDVGKLTATGDLSLKAEALVSGQTRVRRARAQIPINATLKSGNVAVRLAAPATIDFERATFGEEFQIGRSVATLTGQVDAKLLGSAISTSAGSGEATLRMEDGKSPSLDLQALDVRLPFDFQSTAEKLDLRFPGGAKLSMGSARIGGAKVGRTSATVTASMDLRRAKREMSGKVVAIGGAETATFGTTTADKLEFDFPFDYVVEANGARIRFARPASLAVGTVVDGSNARIERASAGFSGDVVLRGGDSPSVKWDGHMNGSADAVALDGARLGKARASLPLGLEIEGGATRLKLTAPGEISIGTARSGALRADRALSVKLGPRTAPLLRMTPNGADRSRLDFAVDARASRLVLRDGGRKRRGQSIVADLGTISVTGGLDPAKGVAARLRVPSARLAAQGQRAALSNVDIRLSAATTGAEPTARVRIGTLSRTAPAPAVPPVSVDATLRPRGDLIRFSTTVRTRDAPVRVVVAGTHNVRRGSGRANVSLRGLDFVPGGLQPQTLLPTITAVKDVGGSIAATARLRWSGAVIDGSARVTLKDLAAATDAGSIGGVNGEIVFSSLNPPSTPKGQRVTVSTIDLGPKLSDATVDFALLRDRTLAIERATIGLAGGQIRLTDQKIDPFAETIRTKVEIWNVELAELIGLFDLGDVSATGRLTGTIPLVVSGETVAVQRGRLAAEGGGTLRIRSQQASQVLAAGGEQVQLMLRALEDFRYRTLSVDIEKTTGGDALVSLRTLGHNPRVLDGRPFQINVNLQTNLDRVLAAVAQWYRLSGRALRDIVGGGPLGGTKAK